MSSKTRIEKTLILLAVPALLLSAPATARESDRPVITGAEVFVSEGEVVTTVGTTGLFPEAIVGTVQSGLPAVVELLYRVVDRDDRAVEAGLHSIELRYDVWDNVYWMVRSDSAEQFSSFAAMASAVDALRRVTIIPVAALRPNTEYAIRMSVEIHPLAGREKNEIAGWVGEHVRSGSGSSLREQVLNLNDLIERFFSRDNSAANRSDWYSTGFFNPTLLPAAGEESK